MGQSNEHLKSRMKNHANDVINHKNTTALCKHYIETGHKFDFGNVQLLTQENNFHKRSKK